MPIDSEPIVVRTNPPDDITSILVDIVSHMQVKMFAIMFIAFIFLSSDIFINRVLATFAGAVNFKTPSSWGVTLQGIFLVLIMLTVDVLIKQNII